MSLALPSASSLALVAGLLLAVAAVASYAFLRLFTPRSKAPRPHPAPLSRPPTVYVSFVVPAYNEQKRLPSMLRETLDYLAGRRASDKSFTYEILVIDDGSKDATARVASEYEKEGVRVIKQPYNCGKGGAVITGTLNAAGQYILFLDADGATKVSEFDKLEKTIKSIARDGRGVAIGSRAHLNKKDSNVKRSPLRRFLMWGFHTAITILGVRGLEDTQCGFKLFTRQAALDVFPCMHVEGWIFDIEMLLLSQHFRHPIAEVPVQWQEIDGSKMDLLKDSIKMLRDLFVIRGNYLLGIWKAERVVIRSE